MYHANRIVNVGSWKNDDVILQPVSIVSTSITTTCRAETISAASWKNHLKVWTPTEYHHQTTILGNFTSETAFDNFTFQTKPTGTYRTM